MKKKQLFAVLLAGSMTVGMAPAAAFAAEDTFDRCTAIEVFRHNADTPFLLIAKTLSPVKIFTKKPAAGNRLGIVKNTLIGSDF